MGDINQFLATVDLPLVRNLLYLLTAVLCGLQSGSGTGRGYGPSGGQTVAQSLYGLRYTGCCTVTRSIEVVNNLLSLSSVNISRRLFKQYIQ